VRKWSEAAIVAEICRRYDAGLDLSYSVMCKEDLALLRAASRYFGGWEKAVTAAGLKYEEIRKYRSWTKERIVARIRELNAEGKDLSWRHVATILDPSLAAAATKSTHFGSWRAALEQAGLDYQEIRRYIEWDDEKVLTCVRGLYAEGRLLNAKAVEQENVPLITAARRRFPSWGRTLHAAGLDPRNIVLRSGFGRTPRRDDAGNGGPWG
jgi:hypothetical protein